MYVEKSVLSPPTPRFFVENQTFESKTKSLSTEIFFDTIKIDFLNFDQKF